MLNGKPLEYDAIAGESPQKTEAGKTVANMFYVAYKATSGDTNPAIRPITFCFNGGPGAAAVWLHLGAAGPKTIDLNDHNLPVGPPYKLTNNPATWLAATDLVFIDPISTGYSRPASGVKADEFHGVMPDVKSVANFIRLYLTQHERWNSPKFIAGESYGTTRASLLAGYLAEKDGIDLNGVVLISSVLDFQSLISSAGNDLPYEMYLPSYTAVAWYHHKLSKDLQANFKKTIAAAQDFAVHQYAPALLMGSALPANQRAKLVKELSSYTGLPADLIDRANLRISPSLFEKRLLGDGHKIIGRFDGELTGYDPDAISNYPSFDPSLSYYESAFASTFNNYIRRQLKYTNDLPYEVLTGVGPWSLAGRDGSGYLYTIDDLQQALLENPHLRVMFVSGYFDLATPFYSADYTIDRLNLDPAHKGNVTHVFFPTGHMVYLHSEQRLKLEKDIAGFINDD